MKSVVQEWVSDLPLMQQTVLLTAIRGPDGESKFHPAKDICRWLRRCILLSAFDGRALETPCEVGGGSFTGPLQAGNIRVAVRRYLEDVDMIPLHYFAHLMHAAEILGYKHPNKDIRFGWYDAYDMMVGALHLNPEEKRQLDDRLCDRQDRWEAAAERNYSDEQAEREREPEEAPAGFVCNVFGKFRRYFRKEATQIAFGGINGAGDHEPG